MKILFLTHDTSRSGAPLVLLYFLKWLKNHRPEIIIDVITLDNGSLESDFEENCNTLYNYSKLVKPKSKSLIKRLLLKLSIIKQVNPTDKFVDKLANEDYQLIYANTILTIPLASKINNKIQGSKFIAHIHELNVMIEKSLPNINDFFSQINQIIVPSKLVKTNLLKKWSIPESIIEVVHEFTALNHTSESKKNEEVFTVGASGLVHWRKGYDIFIQLARYIKSNYSEAKLKFVWVGRVPPLEKLIVKADIQKLDLMEEITFIGELEHPSNYYDLFDVFVMTSREDPFPLVCIEVGMLGKPIISFEKATGSNEIIRQGGGFIVPYLDIESMAERIMTYYSDRDLIKTHGEVNKEIFSQFTPENVCPKLFEKIELHLNCES